MRNGKDNYDRHHGGAFSNPAQKGQSGIWHASDPDGVSADQLSGAGTDRRVGPVS